MLAPRNGPTLHDNANRLVAGRHPLRRNLCAVPTWELKGYAVGAWGNLCKAGLPSRRQNAAHDQITERFFILARFRNFHWNAVLRTRGEGWQVDRSRTESYAQHDEGLAFADPEHMTT